jgi:hypothetical protein
MASLKFHGGNYPNIGAVCPLIVGEGVGSGA